MVMRVLQAQQWVDRWETASQSKGLSPDDIGTFLFVTAALLQHEQGKCLMETCVDAGRKLGCSHTELAFVLGNSANRIHMVKMGQATQSR